MADVTGSPSSATRPSATEQVADALRVKIWTGEFEPDTHLREVALATEFGVARSTAREAIRSLAAEGIVHIQRNQGAAVATMTLDDISDLYAVRRLLELEAVRRPPERRALLEPLRLSVEAMEAGLMDIDPRQMVECDCDFHSAIVGLRDSPRMSRFFTQLTGEIRLALGMHLVADAEKLGGHDADGALSISHEEHHEVAADHRLLYERIAAGREVQHILESHFDRGEQRLRSLLTARTNSAGINSRRFRGTRRPDPVPSEPGRPPPRDR